MKGLIIFPTYNEAENIEKIIIEVLGISENLDILVVDDDSPDGTAEIVQLLSRNNVRINLIRRRKKLGLGTAYIAGFNYALAQGYDFVFEMDADFSHNPNDLPRFINELDHYDLIIGSRYCIGVSVVNWPMKRLLLSYFANMFARIVTGVPVKDLTSGFKCYTKTVLQSLELERMRSDGYGFQIEIDYMAWRKGFRIKEIPIIFIERRAGHSKMSKKIIWQAFFLVWRLRLKQLLGKE